MTRAAVLSLAARLSAPAPVAEAPMSARAAIRRVSSVDDSSGGGADSGASGASTSFARAATMPAIRTVQRVSSSAS